MKVTNSPRAAARPRFRLWCAPWFCWLRLISSLRKRRLNCLTSATSRITAKVWSVEQSSRTRNSTSRYDWSNTERIASATNAAWLKLGMTTLTSPSIASLLANDDDLAGERPQAGGADPGVDTDLVFARIDAAQSHG